QKLEAIGRLAGGVAHDFNNILMSVMGAADLLLLELGPDHAARGEANEIKQSVERGAGVTRQLLAFSRRQATRSRLFALGDIVRGMETMLDRKSTRLNSSHSQISYAVFCLKKKKIEKKANIYT